MSGVPSVYIQDQSNTLKGSIRWYQEEPSGKEIPTLTMQNVLRKGSLSIVGTVSHHERVWVLKIPAEEKHDRFIQREVGLLISLNRQEKKPGQEYLVQIIACITIGDRPMTLMKFYQWGDLLARAQKTPNGISLDSTLKITEQMLKALVFLKEEKIIHRDIKLSNIFIEEGDSIKLGDFGFAMREEDIEERRAFCGDYEAMSPELLEARRMSKLTYPYGSSSDVWAAGTAMFAAFSKCDLVLKKEDSNWIWDLQAQQQNAVEGFDHRMGWKWHGESSAFILFRKTLKGMLTLDPSERLTPEAGMALFLESRPLPFLV